ncbi:MAG: type I-D CRISPR-associated protein Cas5/Csc1 [Chloroflexaceae bacterium]|nr:type I-D CRISPR-associated protein Cas5/Csc1 [Chloroflexaceae bacterium]NJO07399.1 type I-D CRISPR-associated protein Cas5/Csc1 [Chloroflexaceae bacterium]
MMHIYACSLTLHEPLFHATRETGRLYETGRYLHNYALTYAFGFATSPWFHAEQVPHYRDDLEPLNEQVYVTPAEPLTATFQLATFKYGEEVLHVEMQQATRNTPSFGRAKELAPESVFHCFIISTEPRNLPRWIRLGKWHSKALVRWQAVAFKQVSGDYRAACPLNALDLPGGVLRVCDIVSMPPASLVANAHCTGSYYALPDGRGIPIGMRYQVPM